MSEYHISTCLSGYVLHKEDAPGRIPARWAFTTAKEATDKLLELTEGDEAKA